MQRRRGLATLVFAIAAALAGLLDVIWLMALLLAGLWIAFCGWLISFTWIPADIAKASKNLAKFQLTEETGLHAYDQATEHWLSANAPAIYHRRYVVPRADMDNDGLQMWQRAIAAANQIGGSKVVSQDLVDSPQIRSLLPYRLWEIAERLARIAMLTEQQHEILRDIEPGHPDVASMVTQQDRLLRRAVDRVVRRVEALEVLAQRLAKADEVKRREEAARRLANLNAPLRDLVADGEVSIGEPEVSQHLTSDIESVIEQARQAIAEANEAAQSLMDPDEDED